MATSIQGPSGAAMPESTVESEMLFSSHDGSPSYAPGAQIGTERGNAGDSPLLFVNRQPEPLVEYPAAPLAPPIALPADLGLRLFDIALASVFLFLLWPAMLAAALCVRASGPGPIIFRHVRVGKDGARFVCFKFRTMKDQADVLLTELLGTCGTLRNEWQSGQKMLRDPRVTRVGQVLRRFSIDELPQLINVLRGDMSLVGPRPIVDSEISRYGANFADYCSVRPGLTGLWQISGRNCLSYERRVELDSHYARNRTLAGDLSIICRTVPVVLRGSGC